MTHSTLLQADSGLASNLLVVVGIGVAVLIFLVLIALSSWYKKVPQGKALVRTGVGGTKVSFEGMLVIPVLHKLEIMDISLKNVEINRTGKDGLICADNMRADIKVVFFVRVNKKKESVVEVAQTIGTHRASDEDTLNLLFDAKFSEALKTVGKQFNFVDLYNSREAFKQKILEVIGTDLNGYDLDDAAIDYLEQTPVEFLKDDNILDAEGIKKIADLTAEQHIAANKIRNEEKKVIRKQDVEREEAILELNRQLAEKEQVQKREIASITAREEAETTKIQMEEKLRSEQARINTEEEVGIAEQNKQRQVLVASKARERTDAVETERVKKDRELEVNERERVVTLAQIEKEKAVEEERKNIQEVIRERIVVEKATVTEEEKIKDTRAFAEADRQKKVAITQAEESAQEALIKEVQTAEAMKQAAEIQAKQRMIDADTELAVSEREAEAKKKMAEAVAAEEAALGMSEAQVMEAKAIAREREGEAEAKILEVNAKAEATSISVKAEAEATSISSIAVANEVKGLKEATVMEQKAVAEAKGKEALADAAEKEGLAEAKVMLEKLQSEAQGIEQKANAMKLLDAVGKDHEEFKLRLEMDTRIELARIEVSETIAESQALVLAEALKSANIDIVGGEPVFFDKLMSAITRGRTLDAMVDNSTVLQDVQQNLLNDPATGNMIEKLRETIKAVGVTSEDLRNLSVAALILKLSNESTDVSMKGMLTNLLNAAWQAGVADKPAGSLGLS